MSESSLVEGVGDEVVWAGVALLLVLVLTLAWLSTGVRPLWGSDSVWYVQLQPGPQRRILRVLHIEEATAEQLRADPATRTVEIPAREIAERDRSPEGSAIGISSAGEASSTGDSSSLSESEEEAPSTNAAEATTSAQSTEARASDPEGGDAQIRLKFLDETQRMVATFLTRSVGEFKRQHFESEVSSGRVIRLIYQGQLLRDDERSLASYGLTPGAILHCHVSTTPLAHHAQQHRQRSQTSQPNSAHRPDHDPGLGRFMYVLFGAKFLGFWAFYVNYPQFFDATSIASLLLITAFFAAFLWHNLRPRPQPSPTPSPPQTTTPNAQQ